MALVQIRNFSGGIADDYSDALQNEASIIKHFDIFGYPNRLQPLRGMTDSGELTGSGIGKMILGENGSMYAVGYNPGNTTQGELYKRTGFGSSDFWTDFGTDQLASNTSAVRYDFLVHFPEMGATRKLFWADPANILVSDPADGGSSIDSEALTTTTIGQGLVHPKDTTVYFPYQTSTATHIAKIPTHASDPFGNFSATAFSGGLPLRYRAFCLSHWGDYLAIPLTVSGIPTTSIVALWDRDTTLTTFNDTVPWGHGQLKVLNNLNGVLIGISVLSSEVTAAGQDVDKIQIKGYAGGASPFLIKELTATRLTTTAPSCVLNHRVNFVYNNRLYFSVNVVNGDSNANYYGLWSVGLNKYGKWTVTLERVATNDNSDTGVLAAAMYGDFVSVAHTSVGTLTYTINGNVLSSIYGATSVYESTINQGMPTGDKFRKKTLQGVYATYLPLPAAGQVVMKYRVNSNLDDAWTTIFTETTDGQTRTEAIFNSSGVQLSDFTNIEFRLESTGGAIITEFGYKYDVLKGQL